MTEKELRELRDRFAIAALTGLLAGHRGLNPETVADDAYRVAAQMIARRSEEDQA